MSFASIESRRMEADIKTAEQHNTCLALCKVTRSFQAERGTPQGLLVAIVKHCRDERLLDCCTWDGSPQNAGLGNKTPACFQIC